MFDVPFDCFRMNSTTHSDTSKSLFSRNPRWGTITKRSSFKTVSSIFYHYSPSGFFWHYNLRVVYKCSSVMVRPPTHWLLTRLSFGIAAGIPSAIFIDFFFSQLILTLCWKSPNGDVSRSTRRVRSRIGRSVLAKFEKTRSSPTKIATTTRRILHVDVSQKKPFPSARR